MSGPALLRTYRECESELLRFLGKRLGSHATAADIAQDLYIKLLRTRNLPPIHDAKRYLFRMASNLAIDHMRVESRRREILAEESGLIWSQTDELTPERHILARAELAHMKAAIATLTPRCRHIFYLRRFEGKTQLEISKELEIGLTTVQKDLKLAMVALLKARRQFQKQENSENENAKS